MPSPSHDLDVAHAGARSKANASGGSPLFFWPPTPCGDNPASSARHTGLMALCGPAAADSGQ